VPEFLRTILRRNSPATSSPRRSPVTAWPDQPPTPGPGPFGVSSNRNYCAP